MSSPSQVESIFFAALEKKSAAERAAYLAPACGDDDALRLRVERLLDAHPKAEDFLAQPAVDRREFDSIDAAEDLAGIVSTGGSEAIPGDPMAGTGMGRTHLARNPGSDGGLRLGDATWHGVFHRRIRIERHDLHDCGHSAAAPPRRIRPRPGHRRTVHAARSSRRGGDGHRLPGRAIAAGQAAGGAEADQARHGLAHGAGSVRRRTTSSGADGPPQHRPGLRRRRHGGESAVFRDGARQRRLDHGLLRPAPAPAPGPAGVVRFRLPGRATRPPERDHPPRPEAG